MQWNNSDAWVEVAPTLGGAYILSTVIYDAGGGDALYGSTNIGELYQWNDTDAWVSVADDTGADSITGLIDYSGLYACTRSDNIGHIYKWNDSDAWVDQTPSLYAPVPLNLTAGVTPAGNLTGTYYYYYTYRNSVTGHESALSPMSLAATPSTQQVNLTSIAASSDTQVDKKRIYRTGGTLSTINYIGEIDNATTTFTDNTGDTSVGMNEDISNHQVLPAVRSFAMHHHQLFAGYSDDEKGFVYDSKFYLPESFPSLYFFRIGNDSDYIVAVKPLAIDMIVYSRFHTYRMRYIGAGEGDILMEEVAAVGVASDNTLATGIDPTGEPFHVFLGLSLIHI